MLQTHPTAAPRQTLTWRTFFWQARTALPKRLWMHLTTMLRFPWAVQPLHICSMMGSPTALQFCTLVGAPEAPQAWSLQMPPPTMPQLLRSLGPRPSPQCLSSVSNQSGRLSQWHEHHIAQFQFRQHHISHWNPFAEIMKFNQDDFNDHLYAATRRRHHRIVKS